jgi:hypothetical protein
MSGPQDTGCGSFKGNLPEASIYAFWVRKNSGYAICYFHYYGYNRGKSAGGTVYGNHVGDWEHVTVFLDANLKPVTMYFAAHDGGEGVDWGRVNKTSDGHPIVWAALGSHGSYASEGTHDYKGPLAAIFTGIKDECSSGTKWDTWNHMIAFDFDARRGLSNAFPWPAWMNSNYYAPGAIHRFGNHQWGQAKIDTGGVAEFFGQSTTLGDYWQLEDGPKGPIDKSGCWDPAKFGTE